MSTLFAKYRVLEATIRVESAVSTAAGGQYGVFFDPNPANDWSLGNAVGALTSMPAQDIAAAWECSVLRIPRAELERNMELYTQENTSETLVTRFGQVVLLNLATANVNPPGTAEVTVWLDATWEFYEPNTSAPTNANPVFWQAGNWILDAQGVANPGASPELGTITQRTVYDIIPDLPSSLAVPSVTVSYAAFYNDGNLRLFSSESDARLYASIGNTAGMVVGNSTPTPVPRTAFYPIGRYASNGQEITS
jgi:hypothetical protein